MTRTAIARISAHSTPVSKPAGSSLRASRGIYIRARVSAGVAVLVLVATVGGLLGHPTSTNAATSDTVNFQAKLMTNTGAVAPDGNYNVEFNLYTTASGGTSLWTEDWLNTASQGIRVSNGYLTVNLGAHTPFPNNINWAQNMYIGMTVRGTGNCSFGSCIPADSEMTPRLKLTAVPFAFSAGNLSNYNTATGFTGTLSFQGATGHDQAIQIPDINAGGGTASSDTVCLLTLGNCFGGAGGGIAGSGTQNFIAKFDNTSGYHIGSSSIYDDGNFVGINNSLSNDGLLSVHGLGATQSTIFVQGTGSATAATAVIKQGASQTGNLVELQDENGNVNASFNNTGNILTLGRVATTGTVKQGQLKLADGTNDGFTLTVKGATLTNNSTVTIPASAANDTVCLLTLANCAGAGGGITGTGTQNYIAKFDTAGGNHISSDTAGAFLYDDGNFLGVGTNSNSGFVSIQGSGAAQSSLFVQGAASASAPTIAIKQATSQGGDLLQLVDTNGNALGGFAANGSMYYVNSGHTTTLSTETLTSDQLISLPNGSGTLCLQGSSACGFELTGGNDFIQNQTASTQTAGFKIDGNGTLAILTANTSVLTSLIDSANVGGAIALGTTNATGGINLNQNTTIAAGKSISFAAGAGNFDMHLSSGTFQTGTGNISLNGNTTIAVNKGITFATGSGNFDQSASSGTFQTGTGAVSLNGAATANNGLTVANGGSLATQKGADYSTTGSTNDVNLGTASLVRLTGASAQTITGIAGGVDGRLLTIVNAGNNTAIIKNNDTADSAAANVVISGTGNDLSLPAGSSVSLIYDAGNNVWRTTSAPGVSATGSIGSPSANGIVINGNTISLTAADGTNGGALTAGTQTIGGDKTFAGLITGNAGLNVSGGAITLQGSDDSSITTASGKTLTIDSGAALTIGATNATGITIGHGGITTEIQGDTKITLSSTSGATLVCQNTSGLLSSCTNSYETTNGTDFIQNQTGSTQTAGFKIDGTGTVGTIQIATTGSIDTSAAGALNIGLVSGGNATSINLNQNVNLANGVSITYGTTGNFDMHNSTGTFSTGTGNVSINGATTAAAGITLTNGGSLATQKGTDYSTIGVTNNVNFGSASLYRLTGASAQTITGIAGGVDGRILTIVNAGNVTATLKDSDTTDSTAANIIVTGTNADMSLPVGASITLIYDAGANVWRVNGSAAGSGGVSSIGAISSTSNANGATITGHTLSLTAADANNGGVVTKDAQTFAGLKTFQDGVTASNINTTTGQATNLGNSTGALTFTGNGSSTFVINGSTIDATEFTRLDGKDAALVDTNDAVNTAITGTGTLTSGAINWSGAITTSGNISTTGTGTITAAGLLNANGGLTATNINTTAGQATNIGNSTGAFTVTGNGSSTFVVNGVTIDATEFNRLDGKDAALVDTNDAVATAITGTGTLTTGSINWSGAITTSGNISTTGTGTITAAGLITANGGLTATNINNAAGQGTVLGNTTGTVTITGDASSTFVINGSTIDATEFNRLDGKDAALVDVNDAVNTAITGTGTLTSGSINWSGAITTSGNISTTGTGTITSAGMLTANGGLTATNINTTAGQATNLGNSTSGLTITGDSTSTFVINGSTIDATEFNRLDGKDAALVDTNDAVATAITGTGTLTSGTINWSGNIQTSGNISTTGTGTITSAGLITANGGLTAANINNAAGQATSLGNSTGALTITGSSSSTFVINGSTIDASEFTLLDGKDAAIVDVNDAVNTAITGTGTLTSGAINWSGAVTTSGNISTTGTGTITSAGLITANGGLTATNINTTAAQATNLGNSTGTLTVTGNSSSTFVINGVTVDATEFNRLDGKDAALVDTNDAVATAITGTGILTQGSINWSGNIQTSGNISTTGTGTITSAGVITANGGLTVANTGSLATQKGTDFATGGSSDNVNFGTGSLYRLTGSSAQTITGIAGGVDGRILTLVNAGSNAATLVNNSGASAAANRIITGTGADLNLPAGSSISLVYDSGDNLWRVNGSVAYVGAAGVNTVGAISTTSNANGATITGTTINLTAADATNGGVLTSGAQTLGGLKTFQGGITSGNINTTAGQATSLGNSTGALTITGNSSSAFVINGTTVDATEFNRLDGKDAALVDTNDAVNTAITGTGTLTSGAINWSGAITTSGNISTTGTGTITAAGLITANGGLTSANINTTAGQTTSLGNSTGTLTITGNSSSTFVINGSTIDATEFTRLDGKDANLVDTNDAVNTAITGTGTLTTGSINWSGAITTSGNISTTGTGTITSAGLITANGGLTATNINTTAAQATNLGNSTGTLTVTGNSSSTFVINGVTVDATEFNRLDGKDAALVDTNDAVATAITGTGTLTSGSINWSGAITTSGNISTTGTGTITSAGIITANGGLTVANTGSLSTAAGTSFTTAGTSANAALNVASFYTLNTSGAAQVIQGITAGRDGQRLTLTNINAVAVTLANNSASATGAKIITGTGSDISIVDGASVELIYDNAASVWRVVGGVGGTSVTTIGAISTTANANGATITGNTLNLTAANASNGGVLTAAGQTIGGLKTFQDGITSGSINTTAGQATSLGNATGTLTVTGNSSTTFVINGTTVDATEFTRLDGKDANLVDTNDAVNTAITGTGTLTSGSINWSGTITTSGNISTTGTGTITAAGLITANGGLTAANINTTAGQATSLGNSTGAITFTGNSGTTFVINGVTVDATEFNRLDGKDANLVDTNDAVNTAITGTGTLTSGSINWSGTIQTSGNISTTGTGTITSAGLLTANGGLTSANINTTAGQATSLGNSTGTVTITGNSSSTFVINGVTVDATEFGRLDGKDAALVDTNDAVNTAITGTGTLTSGSINWSGAITTSGNISTTGTGTITAAGGLTAGNINTTAGQDTHLGNTTGTLTFTGDSGSTFVLNGATVDATEFNRLDGKDAALVDVNDAVSTAITGTGTLTSGSINWSGAITTSGNISTTGTGTITSAGMLTANGGLTATNINGTAAQATNLGNTTGTLTVTGNSSSTFVINGSTIDATEFTRLDGKDANLVDVNDAVSTAITGTGTLTSGSINWSGAISTTGNISTTGTGTITSAGLLTANGGLTATNINTTAAQATNLGNATGNLTVTGNSASTFVINGITVDATEFNRLDGKDAALVDTNDAVATAITGTGTLTTGSINWSGTIQTSGNISTTGTGTITSAGIITANGGLTVANTGSFSTAAGTTFTTPGTSNNAALNVAGFYLLDTSGAAQVINGITAGRDGQQLTLTNVDPSNNVTLTNNSGTATGAKIITGTGGDVTIPTGASVSMIYDNASGVWHVVGSTSATGGSGVNRVGTYSSSNHYSDGAQISGTTITFGSANGSNPGLVDNSAQSFDGAKTFTALITGNAGITTSGGAFSLQGNAASSLTTANGTTSATITLQTGNATSGTAGAITIDNGASSTGTSNISIGGTNAGSISLGHSGITTTITGGLTQNTGAFSLTGNAASVLKTTGAGVDLTLDAGGAIQIGDASSVTATSINLNQSTVLAAGKSITITGGNTASRPSSPTEGMVYYDTDTKQLLVYSNGKWQADRKNSIIVAASNSSQADKDAADYVTTGTSDQTIINNALTAGAGRQVVLLAGTYTISDSISVPNNTILTGVGNGTAIEMANVGATITNMIVNGDTSTGTGATIQNLKLDGRSDIQTGTHTVNGIYMTPFGSVSPYRVGANIDNVQIVRANGYGIELAAAAAYNTVQNSTVSGGYVGIYVVGSNNLITNNKIRGNSQYGIYLLNGAGNNTVTGNNSSANNVGLQINNSANNVISNNTFTSNTTYGIDAGGNSNTITSNNLLSNTIAPLLVESGITGTYLSNNNIGSASFTDSGTATVYAGQFNSSTFNIQPGAPLSLQGTGATSLTSANGTTSGAITIQSGNASAGTAGTITIDNGTSSTGTSQINIGTTNAGAIGIGHSGITTTITGGLTQNTGAFSLTGNAASVLKTTGAGVDLTLDAGGAIQIGTSGATTTTSINLNQNTVLAAGKSITITGGNTASRPSSPTKGMLYFDTDTNQLISYNGTKWVAAPRSATKIVAASNSSQAMKDAADYVTTGTNDQTIINNALTAAAGGTVYLAEGTYTLGGSVTIPNNTKLAGAGRGTIITIADNFNTTINMITNTDTSTGTGVTIQDLQIDGNKAHQSSGTMNGIYLNGMGGGSGSTSRAGAKLSNLWINNMSTNGIYLNASLYNTITNTTFRNDPVVGVVLNAGSNGNTITTNTFISVGTAVSMSSSNNNVINDNFMNGGGDNAIYGNASSYNTMSGNTTTSYTYGLYTESGSNYNNFSNNDVDGAYQGVNIDTGSYNVIAGNNFANNANGAGVELLNGSNNTVTGNSSTGGYYGITLVGSNNNTVTGNNVADAGYNTDNEGIELYNASNNLITGNTVTDSTHTTTNYAVDITSSSSTNNYLSNNTLGGGTLHDLGTGTSYGGQLDGSNNYVVQPAGNIKLNSNVDIAAGKNLSLAAGSGNISIAGYSGTGSAISIVTTANPSSGNALIFANNTSGTPSGNLIDLRANSNSKFAVDVNGVVTLAGGNTTADITTSGATSLKLDTGGSAAITIGGTNASQVNIGRASITTAITGVATITNTTASTSLSITTSTTPTTAAVLVTDNSGTATDKLLSLQLGSNEVFGVDAAGNVKVQPGANIDTNASGTLNFGTTNATTINIGRTTGAVTQAINIGTNATLSSTSNVTIGSTIGGTTTLQSAGGVIINTPTFKTAAMQICNSSCTVTQGSVDTTGAVIVYAGNPSLIVTLPDPTTLTAGRIVYVTAANGSNDFTLRVNGGGTGNDIAMRQNTTATMIWNGSDWTAAGASSSTTLQAAYDNTLTSAGGAELVLSNSTNHNGLTIRDSSTSSVGGTLLEVQNSSAANVLSVNANVTDYANNGGAESTFASDWTSFGTGSSVTRNTATGYVATGTGSANVTTINNSNTNLGVKNTLTSTLTANQHYNVSFAAKLDSGASGTFSDLNVYYSKTGTTADTACTNYSTQTIPRSVWVKVNCTLTIPASGMNASNAIAIVQAAAAARTWYVDNLSVTIAADLNYATDGGVDDSTNFATNWTTAGQGTVAVSRSTTDGYDTSDSAVANVTTGAANAGIRNKLSIAPLASTSGVLYRMSVYAKLNSGAAFGDFKVRYSPDGGTTFKDCTDYNTQTVVTTGWTQITCYVTTDNTSASSPYAYFVETSSAVRSFSVDTFSMTLASSATPNVQVGGGVTGGPTTLLTLDRAASAPIAANNDALLGSMYYDTTQGKIQCYQASGWGSCGAASDTIVTISPEYTNAVFHSASDGTQAGVGTFISDFCSDPLHINNGTYGDAICSTNETYNYYRWTSPQASKQTYAIYVTYQLPSTFKSFTSGSTAIMGRTDSGSSGGAATVRYNVYRSNASGLTQCGGTGSYVDVASGTSAAWQPGTATGVNDPSTCSFSAGDKILFEIDVTAYKDAKAYVGNLGFSFSNK